MSADETHAPPVGPDLDAAIERVLFGREVLGMALCAPWHDGGGWRVCKDQGRDEGDVRPVRLETCGCAENPREPDESDIYGHPWLCLEPVPFFSTRIEDAWQVVAAMHDRGWAFGLWQTSPLSSVAPWLLATFRRGVYPPDFHDAERCYRGTTPPGDLNPAGAICRAALLALEGASKP